MAEKKLQEFTMEMGPMGPIGEGGSLMLRVNRNCPWNQCLFCPVYKEKKFSNRTAAEIKTDIDAARRVCESLENASWEIGLNGRIRREAVEKHLAAHPEIYGDDPGNAGPEQWAAIQTLGNVAGWLANGAERVFLQDANALFLKPRELVEVVRYLKQVFPSVETITAYARSRTCAQRSAEELRELKEAGLSWVFVGIESGSDEVLNFMRKGASQKEHIRGGRKIMNAGIQMAAFVMPGLGGSDPALSRKHVQDTIEVLNEIKPTEIRVRSLAVLETSLLYPKWKNGEFRAPNDDQMVEELRALLQELTFDCTFETLQMTNVFTFKGPISRRETWLQQIEDFRNLSARGKARFLFQRYAYGGYLDCVKSWGKWDEGLKTILAEAQESLGEDSSAAFEKIDRAIFAIKSKGIP